MIESQIKTMAVKIRALDPKTRNIVLRFMDLLISAQESPEASDAVDAALRKAAERIKKENT